MKTKHIIQLVISLVALFVGYPYGGSIFILLMAPIALYLVFSKDGNFLPALMIHCASGTSIMYLIFLAMIFVCITLYSEKIHRDVFINRCFWLLILISPLFLFLVFQRFSIDGDSLWESIGYAAYYFGFWGFLYCYIIEDSVNFNPKLLIYLTFFLLLMSFIPDVGGSFTRLAFSSLYAIQAISIYKFLNTRFPKWIVLYAIAFFLMFFDEHVTTFTEFGITVLTTILVYACVRNKGFVLRFFSGGFIYIAIFILILYGAATYQNQAIVSTETGVDFSSYESFVDRFRFKLYADRAPYWRAAILQLFQLKPILPIHDIPNIEAEGALDIVLGEVEFGAHCTPLQLLRIFGLLMGGILCCLYIMMTNNASKFFTIKTKDFSSWMPYICASFSATIMYFITGTSAMICYYSLFTFGVLGIAYSKYKKNKQ